MPVTRIADMRRALLHWYDRSGRVLPWRVRPEDRARGMTADPYAVWLSEIMLQQTTVPHATPYWHTFLKRWPTVQDLAAANPDQVLAAWAGLGYYARARNLIACAQAVADGGGTFPSDLKALLALPGVGPYTAAAIRALAFDLPAVVVDGNVERVMSRLHAVETPLPKAKIVLTAFAAELSDPDRPGDHAQALMDLGATVCTPTQPDCGACPWSDGCVAKATFSQTDYPRKAPRKVRPVRRGVAFCVVDGDGRLWLRKRPSEGLLGGMLEVPSTPWQEDPWPEGAAKDLAPLTAAWEVRGEVKHVFTHFTLFLEIWQAESPRGWVPSQGGFHPLDKLDDLALPSLMRKVVICGTQ